LADHRIFVCKKKLPQGNLPNCYIFTQKGEQMKKLLPLIFALAFSSLAFAQHETTHVDGNAKHTLTFERGFFFNTYTVDGKESDVDEVERLLLYVPEASDKWSTGNMLRYISWGVAFAGGFCVGYGIADAQADMEYGTFGNGRGPIIIGGAIAIVVGIVLEKVGNSKKDGAIELYNSMSGKNANSPEEGSGEHPEAADETTDEATSFNIQIAPTAQGGIGLAFNF